MFYSIQAGKAAKQGSAQYMFSIYCYYLVLVKKAAKVEEKVKTLTGY